jgi:hypothetical protein
LPLRMAARGSAWNGCAIRRSRHRPDAVAPVPGRHERGSALVGDVWLHDRGWISLGRLEPVRIAAGAGWAAWTDRAPDLSDGTRALGNRACAGTDRHFTCPYPSCSCGRCAGGRSGSPTGRRHRSHRSAATFGFASAGADRTTSAISAGCSRVIRANRPSAINQPLSTRAVPGRRSACTCQFIGWTRKTRSEWRGRSAREERRE